MIETNVETLADHSREDGHSPDNIRKSVDFEGHNSAYIIMTAELAHKFANLLTVLEGNLHLLHRQPLNDKGQRQLAWAEEATEQLCNLFNQREILTSLPSDISVRS